MMDFSCPHCALAYQLDDDYLREYGGQTTTCTQCGKEIVLPTAAVQPTPGGEAPLLSSAAPTYPPPEFKGGAWRDLGLVVVTRGGRLPPRCVRCNEPGEGKSIWLRLNWTPRIYTGVLRASQIARFALAEEVMLRVYFCQKHRGRYFRATRAGWLLPLIGACMFICGPILEATFSIPGVVVGALCIGGFFLGLVGFLWRLSAKDFLRVANVDPHLAWIGGCCPALVESLPGLAQANAAANAEAGARLEQIGETSESEG
ncbi:MAG TPA: hypothetical protein VG269_14255 [Tepidisphaeraceae bacterium]|jgi:hypothetical protein|nr:hypothetical protein [Tepidisphaeraceae bacterium]